jgi:hypothetical protein
MTHIFIFLIKLLLSFCNLMTGIYIFISTTKTTTTTNTTNNIIKKIDMFAFTS